MSIVAVCPYFKCDLSGKLKCECAKLTFKDLTMRNNFVESYCASYDYAKCTIARAITDHYDRKEKKTTDVNETYDRII